ncbi:MAG: hypothetical protein U0R49_11525 [Fimbriimonadales bacterium]
MCDSSEIANVERICKAVEGGGERRLLAYALVTVRMRTWPETVAIAELAQDLVMDAIGKALTGERRWNPQVTPDPLNFLRSVIKSDISNEHRKVWHTAAPTSRLYRDLSRDDRSFEATERRVVADELILRLIDALDGDEIALKVLENLCEDVAEPKQMAELIGIPKDDILNAKKRIRRAALSLQDNNLKKS